MKIFHVSASKPEYTIRITLEDYFGVTMYSVEYGKCWPCEDGIYEKPVILLSAIGSGYLTAILQRYLDPEVFKKIYAELGFIL